MFSKDFRWRFPNSIQSQYRRYWHAMHPVTFKPKLIYRLGFSDEEWDALRLLRDRRKEVIDEGRWFKYKADFRNMEELPDYMSKRPILTFQLKNNYPEVIVKQKELPESMQKYLQEWILTAYQYQEDSHVLQRKVRNLIGLEYSHMASDSWGRERSVEKALVNTPGVLYRIWPELLPFFDQWVREELRNKKAKSPLPRSWDADDLKDFHDGEAMERINYALSVMSLLPDKHDDKYPGLG